MCSGLHGNEISRYLPKCRFHRFPFRRYFLFQNDFAGFILSMILRAANLCKQGVTGSNPVTSTNFLLSFTELN